MGEIPVTSLSVRWVSIPLPQVPIPFQYSFIDHTWFLVCCFCIK